MTLKFWKMNHALGVAIAAILPFFVISASAQDMGQNIFGNGIRLMAKDSSFSMKFSVRIQSLYEGNFNLETEEYADGFQIRRSRLKFDGFAYDPKLEYKIELAIANSDTRGGAVPESGNTANIVLDAYLKWNFWRNWSLIFGQKKLPGNRERVISSQELQFVDRSNLNAQFNIDRDAGVHLLYNSERINLVGALTIGEGRNMVIENTGGYDYTVRGEYLPFGQFTDEGDYFGADLARERAPKLSIGLTFDYNDGASRTGGQLGDFLPATRDLKTIFADAHFKYRGFSSMAEYVNKQAPDGPVVNDPEENFLDAYYTGEGFNWQAGYLFKNNLELAGRYTRVTPDAITGREQNTQYTFGLSRYFVGHNLKVQTDLSFIEEDHSDDLLMYRLQVELAF
jgi:phosphate-selective porin OprO and OprP